MLPSLQKIIRISEKLRLFEDVRIIIEIGANTCSESVDFSVTFPNVDIYPFECNPDTIPRCKEKIKGHPRIHLIEKAVSDKNGASSFFPIDTTKAKTPHEDGNPGASSMFMRNESLGVFREELPQKKVTVESITLHTFMTEQNISSIDILWLDAQGAELMILKGLGEKISKVNIIQCEVEFVEEYKGQPLWKDIVAFAKSNGFVVCGFTEEWYPHAADAIFIDKKIISRAGFLNRCVWCFLSMLPVKPLISRRISHRLRKIF